MKLPINLAINILFTVTKLHSCEAKLEVLH